MQVLTAFLLDALLGDPKWLPHPIKIVGHIISFYEKIFYSEKYGKIRGVLFCLSVLATVIAVVSLVLLAAGYTAAFLERVLNIYLLYSAIAFKSLKDESMPVFHALVKGDIEQARKKVGWIVGRDTDRLDEEGIIRATVETIAESYIDGIVSVLFWMTAGLFFGRAAIFAWFFKAASTMDSMVGYDDERYHDFGWASAKLDDILNFIPARLGALISICAGAFAGMDYRRAWRIFIRDRLNHKSPNSAHAESVFAGLLGIRLGGGAFYSGEWESRPSLGEDLRTPEPKDILSAHKILNISAVLCAALILVFS
ncbi:MAG: adenosylcobinamide-phosphate synthase CbiB [Synergistaceae bacterium]|nr:adenosylcobinamide-phosphate synthase CbiB [Synergistaceae bacterium]